jgi:hypothetical protein
MGTLLGIIVLVVVLPYLASRISQARNAAWTGPQTPAMRQRAAGGKVPRSPGKAAAKAARSAGHVVAHPSNGAIRAQAKADAYAAWQQAFATDYLEQQRHARANGTPAPAVLAAAARPSLRQRLRLAPPAAGQQNGTAASPAAPPRAAPAPASGNGGSPARQFPPPPQPSSSNGGSTVASTTGAEQLIEGVNRIHAEAAAGGIHHKQAALKAAAEGSIRFSAMAQMLSRTMSEPGNNYGPEITEPLAKAAQHLQAAAMSFGEADTNVTSMIHMSVGDLARSPRQAPHHSELSENGSK